MSIAESVEKKNYRIALELQALRLAKQLDTIEDEKNLAGISRELRLILSALGIDEEQEDKDRLPGLTTSIANKLRE